MKFIFFSALMIVVSVFAAAPMAPDEVETEVIISNIKSPRGVFVISFYDKAADFPKVGKDLLTEKVAVKDTLPQHIKIRIPSEGWYAIAMYQDIDGKDKIRQDPIGIPEEPYAFSNNIHPKVAVPTFASCRVYISRELHEPIQIKLIQPKFHGKL